MVGIAIDASKQLGPMSAASRHRTHAIVQFDAADAAAGGVTITFVLPALPGSPCGPAGPAGPGAGAGVGTATTAGGRLSHATSAKAAIRVDEIRARFMVSPAAVGVPGRPYAGRGAWLVGMAARLA
jgi:hypothetical protein